MIQNAYIQASHAKSNSADSACETNRHSKISDTHSFKYSDNSSGVCTNSSRRDSNVPEIKIGSYTQKDQIKQGHLNKTSKNSGTGQSKVSNNSYVSFDRAVKSIDRDTGEFPMVHVPFLMMKNHGFK